MIPWCLLTNSHLQLLTVRQQLAVPEESLQVLCSTLPHVVAVFLKVQELSGNLLDHPRSCILSCTLLFLTHFLYVCFEFTNPFIKNKWQYDAVQNAVCESTLLYTLCLVLCIYIHTCKPSHHVYLHIVISITPIMARAKLTSPSPETYSAQSHLVFHASTV